MKTLDPKKPHGQVYGQHETGAAFEQDGVLFGPDGKQVGSSGAGPSVAAAAPAAAAVVPEHRITLANGTTVVLDGMEREAVLKLAADNKLELHAQLGLKRAITELEKAFPYKAPEPDQVESQLGQE